MSAELLALAARAADAYARVKGPWLRRTGLEAYPDPISPHELVVRAFLPNGRRESGLVIFNPLSRKEMTAMPETKPPRELTLDDMAVCKLCGALVYPETLTLELHDRFHEEVRR